MAKEARRSAERKDNLGTLPVWNLNDLYPGMDAPEVTADLERGTEMSKAFEARYKGNLKAIAEGPNGGAGLAEAIAEYERIEEILGRLGSFAGLVHAADTSDPVRAKFYGDLQEQLTTTSTFLLFFGLELNRLEDAVLEQALQTPALAVYRPWIEELRLERPYQLDDQIEKLFHEKYVTGRGAWNRLFDETLSGLSFEVDGESLPLEPTLNRLVDPDGAKRRARPRRSARPSSRISGSSPTSPTCSPRTRRSPTNGAASRMSRQHGIFRTASSRRWWMRWSLPSALPIRGFRTATMR